MRENKEWSSLYYLDNNRLYKRSLSMLLLMCLNDEEVDYVLWDLHEGICRSRVVGLSLVTTPNPSNRDPCEDTIQISS